MKMNIAIRNALISLLVALPCSVSADWLYFISRVGNTLSRVDTTTLEQQVIGELGFTYLRGGIAWDPEEGKLLVLTDPSGGVDQPKLYLVDPYTAAWELVGTVPLPQNFIGSQRYGLEYVAAQEQIYVSYQSSVVKVNRKTLKVTDVASAATTGHEFGGLAYDSDFKRLYAFDADGSSWLVKASDKSITLDCSPSSWLEGGVAYDPNRQSFWQIDLNGVNNDFYTRILGPTCSHFIRAQSVGLWADNLAFVPADEVLFGISTAFNDAWFNPLTPGQGFMIAVLPNQKIVFLAWFTWDVERPPEDTPAMLGDPGHRWLTAQGSYEGDTANLIVSVTRGGVFDSNQPPATTDPDGDGTITLQFADCENGLIEYEITSLGLSGSIPIERVAPDNISSCQSASGDP